MSHDEKPQEHFDRKTKGYNLSGMARAIVNSYSDTFFSRLSIIEHSSKAVIEGVAFSASALITIGSNSTNVFSLQTGDKSIFLHSLELSTNFDGLESRFYEDPSLTIGATNVPFIRLNRNADPIDPEVVIQRGGSGLTGGLLLDSLLVSPSAKTGMALTQEVGMILKPNTLYARTFQNTENQSIKLSTRLIFSIPKNGD
jgi:hypothetical protein